MSEFNDIKNLWKSAENQIMANESLDSEMINRAVREKSIGISSKILKSIRAGILALGLSIPLFSYNIFGYAGNNLLIIINIFCLSVSTLLFLFLINNHKNFNKIDKSGLKLKNLIVAKIRYFRNSLPFVRHAIALGIVLFTFSLNLLTDNNEGYFQVNNIGLFIGLMIISYLLVIIMLQLIHNLFRKQYINVLDDLDKSKLNEIDIEHRKYKLIRLVFFTIILTSAIVGIIFLLYKK